MKRLKKQKKQVSSQNDAINYLSLISERETGYLQDWAIINQIRQQQFQSSNQLQRQTVNNPQNPENKPSQWNYLKQQKDIINQRHTHFGRKIQVRVQNFANVPHRKFCSRIPKATLLQIGKYNSKIKQQATSVKKVENVIQQRDQLKKQQNESIHESHIRLNNPISMNYIEKIRRLSLPWLKNLPKLDKSQEKDFDKQQKARQQNRRLNQIIKNKIRRKHSNRYLIQKKLSQIQNTQRPSKNEQSLQNQNDKQSKQSSEIKLLKNWLEYNRSKKKRSITSLLTEHFQNKYLEKKKQRQKAMALKSTKAISVLSNNYEQKIH